MKPKLPFIPGGELSGKVIEVGRDVRTVAVGDSVSQLAVLQPHMQREAQMSSALSLMSLSGHLWYITPVQ